MKKLVFSLIAALLVSSFSFGQAKPVPTNVGQNGVKSASKIHIEFGRKSKACMSFGICVFTIDFTFEDLVDTLDAFVNNEKLNITFDRSFYDAHKSKFKDGYLVVEEDFAIDRATTSALGLKDGYTIKTGKYAIVLNKSNNTYNCTF